MKGNATITLQIPLDVTPDLLERILNLAERAGLIQSQVTSLPAAEAGARGEHDFEGYIVWDGTLKKRTTSFLGVGDN